jgi:hypothetical protein
MLKTNSKKARENIKNYIIENFGAENYTDTPPTEWHEIAIFIYECFRSEKWCCKEDYAYYRGNEWKAFLDWCSGLPSVLDTCYFYNRSAVEDLGNILEETETERKQYEESTAENLLTMLIYNEIKKEIEKNVHKKN